MNTITTQLVESQKLAQQIESLLLDSGGELNEELEKLLVFQTESKELMKQQVDNVAFTVERIEALSEFYGKQVQALNRMLSGLESTKDKILSNVISSMQSMQLESLRGNNIEFKMKKNPPSLELSPEIKLPDHFVELVMTEKILKKEIINALKVGETIPGARLLQKTRLSIGLAKPQLKEVSSV